ncbi:MAG: SCO family protein [Deltaproteobacteria bacterium]|nr:SCO family protein [Deltaproteobacteria bacterium]
MKAMIILLSALAISAQPAPSTEPQPPRTQTLPVFEREGLTPPWRAHDELTRDPHSQFPAFTLRDQSGAAFTKQSLDGKLVIANFMFIRCSQLCPILRASMQQVRESLHGDSNLLFVSHSVTPGGDSREELAAYAQKNHIEGTWRIVTGAERELDRVQHEGYLLPRPRTEDGPAIHSELFVLLDRHQRVRGVYNGTLRLELDLLARDVRALEATDE